MATYLNNVTDKYPQEQQFAPDYSFLSGALQNAQQKFDRGAAAVKSLYNSSLNTPTTNEANSAYKDTVFAKIENDIKTLSTIDLSRAENISYANQIFAPITDDEDLNADRYITQKNNQALRDYEYMSKSPDAEKRALANPLALEHIQNGILKLRGAKRGTGEMSEITPRKFIPFEDITGYLDKALADSKVSIEKTTEEGMYLVKTKNGPDATLTYEKLVHTYIGNRFDAQFRVEAEVQSERKIKGIMSNSKVSYDEAVVIAGSAIKATVLAGYAKTGEALDKHISMLESIQADYKKHYGDNVPDEPNNPRGNPKAISDNIDAAIIEYSESRTKLKTTFAQDSGLDAKGFGENLSSYLFSEAKDNFTTQYAKTYTSTHQEVTKTPNQVKMQEREHRYKIEDMQRQAGITRQNMAYGSSLKMEEMKLDALNKYQLEKAKGTIKENTQFVGPYHSATQNTTALDVTSSIKTSEIGSLVSNTWGSPGAKTKGGLAYAVLGDEAAKYSTLINKLETHAQGGAVTYTQEEQNQYMDLYGKLNKKYKGAPIPSTARAAEVVLYNLSMGVQKLYGDKVAVTPEGTMKDGNLNDFYKQSSAIRTSMDNENDASEAMNKAFELAINSGKVSSDNYETTVSNGKKYYHIKGELSLEEKNAVSLNLPQEYKDMTGLTGATVIQGGLTGGMFAALMNGKTSISVNGVAGQGLSNGLSSYSSDAQAEMYGNQATVSIDPAGDAILTFNVNPESKTAKALGIVKNESGETIQMTIPKDKLKTIIPSMSDVISNNSFAPKGNNYFTSLSKDPDGSKELPEDWAQAGFAGKVTKKTGGYGVSIVLDMKKKNGVGTERKYMNPNVDITNSDQMGKLYLMLEDMFVEYMNNKS